MAKNISFQPRLYRESMGNTRWRSFRSAHCETDLWVAVDTLHYTKETESFAKDRILHYRNVLDRHIDKYPLFSSSLVPVTAPAGAHPLVSEMSDAAQKAGTGPMSAVAGAMAEFITRDILKEYEADEVIVENGGDIFMKLTSPAIISIYAGDSPLSEKIALQIKPEETPLSVCCSSGTVGHSLSFGVADACTIACRSGALADAYATAFCNEVKNTEMVHEVTENALQKPDITSVIIIAGDKVGLGGRIEIKLMEKDLINRFRSFADSR